MIAYQHRTTGLATITGKSSLLSTACGYCLPVLLMVLSACGGGGSGSGSGSGDNVGGTTSVTFVIHDGASLPISDATITLGAGKKQRSATSDADGYAIFHRLPPGNEPYSVTAAGFGSLNGEMLLEGGSAQNRNDVYLLATDAWATPRVIVFGTHVTDRASDGSEMTFSADVAVIDSNSEALASLTSAQFSLLSYDCGWGGPRDCASDGDGNDTGGISFADGAPLDFGLLPPRDSQAFIADILVELSDAVDDWEALQPFFKSVGNNDAVGLASVRREGDSGTYTVHGPYTSDGESYIDAIKALSTPAGSSPPMLDSLVKSIQRVAAVESPGIPGVERVVVVASSSAKGLSVAEFETAAETAKKLGVRVSVVGPANYGFPEIAVRTGGFSAQIDDPRQRAFVFRAMGQLIAGTTPRYRMTFRIGGEPGTFVSGGNAKVMLQVVVPDSIRHSEPNTTLDVAIP